MAYKYSQVCLIPASIDLLAKNAIRGDQDGWLRRNPNVYIRCKPTRSRSTLSMLRFRLESVSLRRQTDGIGANNTRERLFLIICLLKPSLSLFLQPSQQYSRERKLVLPHFSALVSFNKIKKHAEGPAESYLIELAASQSASHTCIP